MTEIAYAIQTGTDDDGRALWMSGYQAYREPALHCSAMFASEGLSERVADSLKGHPDAVSVPVIFYDTRKPLTSVTVIQRECGLGYADAKRVADACDAAIIKRAKGEG